MPYANDALRADELDELVGHGALCVALAVRLDIAQVTDMAILISWSTMLRVMWVDCYLLEPREDFFHTRDEQCGPAEVQPLVLSPNAWTWKPRSAFGSWPVISQVMVVGLDSEACSKVTVPLTLESPRRTATTWMSVQVLRTGKR